MFTSPETSYTWKLAYLLPSLLSFCIFFVNSKLLVCVAKEIRLSWTLRIKGFPGSQLPTSWASSESSLTKNFKGIYFQARVKQNETNVPGSTELNLYFGKIREVLSSKDKNKDMVWGVNSTNFTKFQAKDQGMLCSAVLISNVHICTLNLKSFNDWKTKSEINRKENSKFEYKSTFWKDLKLFFIFLTAEYFQSSKRIRKG